MQLHWRYGGTTGVGLGTAEVKRYWLPLKGNAVEVEDHFKYIYDNAFAFGITQDDVQFSKTNGTDGMLALLDKVSSQGWIWIEVQGGESGGPFATICFWEETYEAYDAIVRWLKGLGTSKKQMVLLRELSSMRGWVQEVSALYAHHQYARDPTKQVSCHGCGRSISHEELVMRRVCPNCGLELA